MEKLIFALAILLTTNITTASTLNFNGSFQLLDSVGTPVSPTDTNVTGWFDYDFAAGIGNGGEFNSGTDLLGSPWQATDVTMTLNSDGMITANMMFNWNGNIMPSVVVFELQATPNPLATTLTTIDGDGDGILGNVLTVGAKAGNSIALNGTATVVPVPAALWLFTSGLFGLFGFSRKKS